MILKQVRIILCFITFKTFCFQLLVISRLAFLLQGLAFLVPPQFPKADPAFPQKWSWSLIVSPINERVHNNYITISVEKASTEKASAYTLQILILKLTLFTMVVYVKVEFVETVIKGIGKLDCWIQNPLKFLMVINVILQRVLFGDQFILISNWSNFWLPFNPQIN